MNALSAIGLTEIENCLLVSHEMGREPQPIFDLSGDCAIRVTFHSTLSVSVEGGIINILSSHSAPIVLHSELGLFRKVSPSLYEPPEASLEVVKRSLRDPLVGPVISLNNYRSWHEICRCISE